MNERVGLISCDMEAWKKAEKVIIADALKRLGLSRKTSPNSTWSKYFFGYRNWCMYALAVRPNRFEVLVQEIHGQKKWVNVSACDTPEDFLYKIYYINPIHEEIYNNQLKALNAGHDFTWEDVINHYKVNSRTVVLSRVES